MSGTNENNYVLYLHISPSRKKYFGITGMKPKYRWNNGHGYRQNNHFWNAIQKYGLNNIRHIILADDLTKEDACLFEQICIALYDTTNHNNGYNNSLGGEHGKHSEESKQKISENNKCEKNYFYGKHNLGKNNHNSKTVICITTRQVFYGTCEASRITGARQGHISNVCTGKRKHAGKLPDGTKLRWAYVQDLPKPQVSEEIKQLLRNGPRLLKSA